MSPIILIVEDDPDIRDVLGEALAARGFTPVTADNGRAALDVVHRSGVRPAVILLDLMMPEMDGEQFLAAKACDLMLASVPALIVTAQPDKAPPELPATVKAIVQKPVPLGMLVQMIRDLCEPTAAPRPAFAGSSGG